MARVCVCAVIYRFRNSKQQPSSSSTEKNQYPQLSYAELHQSTNGFSSDNLIGKGRYGSVYKGILNSDEQTVALKVLNLQESGANKSFLAECEALRNLCHRNLVKVITSYSSIDFKGSDFKALVFEFIQNGSLEGWLYPSSLEQNDTENLNLTQRLNIAIDVALALEYLHHHYDIPIAQRLNIAIDVALALEYLHHHYDIPIAHCDLKPSNVLLDNNLAARVGDFGLAKFVLATIGDSNYAQSSSIGIRGIVGYIAPEYGMGGDISTQGDLYSNGILLLEMFRGKRPTNNMFTNNFNLHSHAKMALPHRVVEIVDPQIIMEERDASSRISQNTEGNVTKVSFTFLLSYLLFYIHSIGFLSKPTSGFTNETDHEALIAIKDLVTSDPSQFLSSWTDSIHFCNWHGVTCGSRHQRVTVLNMSSLHLSGSLSPHIGNLTFLEDINIQNNNLRGTIPLEIGRLFRLQYLLFANNSFQGTIPTNLTHFPRIRVIDLKGNNLEGNIPPELGTFYNLYQLSLSRNHFSGNIPPSLGNLSALQILDLAHNNLHGTIPNELGHLSNLYIFQLSSNNLSVTNNSLSGNFPSNLGLTLPKLQLFLANTNQFFGPIPPSLANASGLVKISIGDNDLTGPIPLNLGSLQYLQVLHIAGNPLGTDKANDISFLTTLINCTNLGVLSLSRIQIGGNLPNSIGNLSSTLTSVWLDQNYISGNIPQEITELVGLSYITIDTNMLTGSIPDSIGKLTNLQEFYLFTNNISGEIPYSIGNITGLASLILEENMLEGSIPVSLGNCSNLQGLHLAQNRLTGGIPGEVIGLASLYLGFIVRQNFLTGPLPSQVGKLENLVSLDISENKLSGEIPSALGNCLMLNSLHMEDNFFEGTIPSELKNLKTIQFMDFSHNNLSGNIPLFLGQLNLLVDLNLSFNNFEGEVPNGGVFKNITSFSVLGNRNLCGGVKELQLPACPTERVKKRSTRTVILVATTIGVSIILLVVCVCAVLYRLRKSKQPSLVSTEENQHLKLSYAELHQSTNGFSLDNLIGKGRYGSVYKGILNSGEQIVAVKVLNLQESGADKSFLAECEALRNLRHRNLVKVITSCSSLDFKGNDFKALVFEFMSNGSLESWLYPSSTEQNHTKNLNLTQRLNVAIDVASALEYLHHHYDIPVAHCDLKPSNVLLDNNLYAHVGDFGLARFLLAATGNSNCAQSSSIGIRGTVGEYGMGGDISTQGDLYKWILKMFSWNYIGLEIHQAD
ncbi:unnamed protein product [Camellia sinensis]